ncbi:MAG: LptA/OstA family protein, partial [Acidocella sp.]|nr:LptA/OstA family protein [Acidocella sp.]
IITAAGHVSAIQGGQTLHADKVVINRNTNVVTASGHVALVQPDGTTVYTEHAVLSDNMKKGEKIVEGSSKKMEARSINAGSVISAGLGGLFAGGAVATAALGGVVASGIERLDQLGDAAQQLGVTTQALSELRYAANLSGSSAEDLDAALVKMNANLGDAATKATPTGDALKKLGLDAREIATLAPDEA